MAKHLIVVSADALVFEDLEFAKDLRIFGLGTWLRELQNKALKTCEAFITRREKAYLWANVVDVTMALLRFLKLNMRKNLE